MGLTEETLGWVRSSVAIHAAPNFSYSLFSEQLLSNKTSMIRTKGKNRFILLDKYTLPLSENFQLDYLKYFSTAHLFYLI